jgi:A/G-specific adenine glycosylase
MERFPTVQALAASNLDDVLKLWEGLGYYSRARNLHASARSVVEKWGGSLPGSVDELMQLKGIGRYTAGAIASIAYDQSVPVVDGNVIRVLTRLIDLAEDVTRSVTVRKLWDWASELVPSSRPGEYNQAFMELGQSICLPAKPRCSLCPLAADCQSRLRGTLLDRPVRPPRKNTPHYDVVAGIIWGDVPHSEPLNDAPFLITRRPLDGLLGGLWEFPGGKQEAGETRMESLHREIWQELGIEIEVGRQLTTVRHAYTHFRITLHAFHAVHKSGRIKHLGVADHAWVQLADVDDYAFASTDRKIIESLRQELALT